MKTMTTAVAVLLASTLMTACGNKDSAAPAEATPAEAPAPAPAPAEAAPAEAAPAATQPNNEDASQTGGDKVSPQQAPPPPSG